MGKFELVSEYTPTGDQPQAIKSWYRDLKRGINARLYWGVTGSGKTFTMGECDTGIAEAYPYYCNNKTLAAQLYGEFKEFFPNKQLSILSPTTTTISRKPTCLPPIPI